MKWYYIEQSRGDTYETELKATTAQEAYKEGRAKYLYLTDQERKHSKCYIALAEPDEAGCIFDWYEHYDLAKTVMNDHGVLIDFEVAGQRPLRLHRRRRHPAILRPLLRRTRERIWRAV